MKYNELKSTKQKQTKRVGRGIASGQGKTAGRGTKGQGARTGYSKKPGFAGGSNPLMQKLPKLAGFRSHKIKAEIVFTDQLSDISAKTVTANNLFEAGLVTSPYTFIKLLSRGELKKAVMVELPSASASAVAVLESSGGSFTKVDRLKRTSTKVKE